MKTIHYLAIGLLSLAAACGGGTATGPADDSTVPSASDPDTDVATEEPDDQELSFVGVPDPTYLLYVLPSPLAGSHEPALPAAWPQSLAIFDEAVVLYEGEQFLEAAAAFLRAADTISNVDPYHAEAFANIRGLMCGNAGWAFLSVEAEAPGEQAAAEREVSDPACAAGLRKALSP